MMDSLSGDLYIGSLRTPLGVGIEQETAWSRWCKNAAERPNSEAIIHWAGGEAPFRWTFSALLAAAEQYASCLVEQGVRRGDVCAIIQHHNSQLYPLYLAVCAAGAIPAILAYPNPRLHPDKFRQGIEGMSRRSGLDWILTERKLQPVLEPLVTGSGSTIRGLHFPLEWRAHREDSQLLQEHPPQLIPTDPLLLQHSSGTTGLQKPVLLSHNAVLEHVKRYAEAISLTNSDKIVSWLPLYHDMGLIAAFHLPLIFGIPSIQIDPFQWAMAPSLLLEAITQERATVTWLPNFAFNMMAFKVRDEDLHEVDLSSLRLIVNCSEPVRYESHENFLKRFQPYGLRPTAFSACYAMAETTFAVTQTPIGLAPTVVAVDRTSLARGKVEPVTDGVPARICVSSGKPIEGCEVRIVDENRFDVAPGSVGEIAITSATMFSGYRNYPEKTAEVLCDGWYYSGDYGFQDDGELFVIGRKKDIIIVAGNNVYPEDVEDAVGAVQGVIPGRVVAIGEENPELGSEHVAAHRRFQVFQQQIAFGSLRSFAWVQELNSLLKHSDDKLVIFVSPVNETLIDTYSSKEYAARCHVEFSRAHQSLLWYLDRQGIPYIDGSNQFDAEDFVDLVHVNVHGERRIAELIDGYVTGGRPISASAHQYTQ